MTCADRPDVQRSLQRLQSATTGGWTALIDSVQLTLDRMRRPRNARKVLVVVSDGQDNHSRYTKAELISRAVESDAQIYTVAVRERPGARKPIELTEEDRGLILLSDLAQATGGQYFAIDAEEEAPAAAAKILSAMHNQYLIGYYPTDPQRPGRRRIQVKLDSSGVRLYARSVYVATAP
jgi:Ca-activated chloride channel family protein